MPFRRNQDPKPLSQLIEERETREGKTRPIPWRPLHVIGLLTIAFIFVFSCGSVVFYFALGADFEDDVPPPTAAAVIPEEFIIRGIIFAEEGKFDLAVRDFTEAIRMRPNYAAAFYNRGLTYTKMERYEDGILDFTSAIAIVPEHQGAHVQRALTYTLLGRDAEAEADITRAIDLGVNGDELRARIEGAKLSRDSATPSPPPP